MTASISIDVYELGFAIKKLVSEKDENVKLYFYSDLLPDIVSYIEELKIRQNQLRLNQKRILKNIGIGKDDLLLLKDETLFKVADVVFIDDQRVNFMVAKLTRNLTSGKKISSIELGDIVAHLDQNKYEDLSRKYNWTLRERVVRFLKQNVGEYKYAKGKRTP
jgi:hypothetical protein